MSINKIKVFAMFGFVALIAAILTLTPSVVVNADGDEFIKEIAEYKTWTKINKEPIRVELKFDFSGG